MGAHDFTIIAAAGEIPADLEGLHSEKQEGLS
jgi:hypothetical protein